MNSFTSPNPANAGVGGFTSYPKWLQLAAIVTVVIALPVAVFLSQQQQVQPEAANLESATHEQIISGYVYIDDNRNGERDFEEKGYAGASVEIANRGRKATQNVVTSDTYGYFKQATSANLVSGGERYTVTLTAPTWYIATTKNPLVLEGVGRRAKRIVEFGIAPNEIVVTIPPRPSPSISPPVPSIIICDGWDPIAKRFVPCPSPSIYPTPQNCLQVFTWGRNVKTQECSLFPSSCLPDGWIADKGCLLTGTPPVTCPTPPACPSGYTLIYGDPRPTGQCPLYRCVAQ